MSVAVTVDSITRNVSVTVSNQRGPAGESGASEWGQITGTLSDQTDLQAALDAISSSGVADGDKGDVTVASSGTVWTVPDLSLKANLAGGNTFSGAQIMTGSTAPVIDVQRTSIATNSIAVAAELTGISTGNAADGFGPVMTFRISDTGVSDELIGSAGFVRDGADNSGAFVVRPQASGSAAERFRVASTGNVTMGTVTTGTWQGTVIEPTYGGTGVSTLASLNLSSLGSGAEISGLYAESDGSGGVRWSTPSGGGGGGDALTSDPLSQFAATTSSQLAGVISDETGSGALVFANSPVLVTPALGTPSSGTLNLTAITLSGTKAQFDTACSDGNFLYVGDVTSNATHTGDATGATALTLATVNSNVGAWGTATSSPTITVNAKGLVTAAGEVTITPSINDVTGLGTGVSTALAINTGSAGAPVLFNGALGTPSSGTISTGVVVPWEIQVACSDETTALTAGTAKVTFRMPWAATLSTVIATVTTAPTGSTLVVDINETGSTILSTKLSIDATEKTSTTAATAAVISDSSLANDAEITIDIDSVGATIAGAGLKVTLKGTRTI